LLPSRASLFGSSYASPSLKRQQEVKLSLAKAAANGVAVNQPQQQLQLPSAAAPAPASPSAAPVSPSTKRSPQPSPQPSSPGLSAVPPLVALEPNSDNFDEDDYGVGSAAGVNGRVANHNSNTASHPNELKQGNDSQLPSSPSLPATKKLNGNTHAKQQSQLSSKKNGSKKTSKKNGRNKPSNISNDEDGEEGQLID